MQFLRRHWFDIGGGLAIILILFLWRCGASIDTLQLILWLNLLALFFHQLEEYRWPGTFPGMVNSAVFKSDISDRYPLNTNTALIINVGGWVIYFLGALLYADAIWLAIAAILISAGNFVAHTFLFNIKGKTIYNAGMITSWLFFLPCVIIFFGVLIRRHTVSTPAWIAGIALGIILNVIIIRLIKSMGNKLTNFRFQQRQMLKRMEL